MQSDCIPARVKLVPSIEREYILLSFIPFFLLLIPVHSHHEWYATDEYSWNLFNYNLFTMLYRRRRRDSGIKYQN